MGRILYFLKDFYPYILVNFLFLFLFVFFITLTGRMRVKKRTIFAAILFFVFISFATFSIFEAYFRYVYDSSDGLGFLKVSKKWDQRHVVFNSNFSRDREFNLAKGENEVRIAAIGDSLTYGYGIKDVNNRFSNLLESKLKAAGKNVSVYNFGIPGIDTEEEVDVYTNNVRAFNPDIVVWQYYLNDIQPKDKGESAKIFQDSGKRSQIVAKLSDLSYFFDFLYWRFNSKYAKTFNNLNGSYEAQYANEVKFNRHKEIISKFSDQMHADGRKVIVVIFPLLNLVGNNYPLRDVHNQLDATFRAKNVEVIDLLDSLDGKKGSDLVASRFDAHPNELVHAIAASKLFDAVLQYLK